jgi:hypothetical protein
MQLINTNIGTSITHIQIHYVIWVGGATQRGRLQMGVRAKVGAILKHIFFKFFLKQVKDK